MGTNYKSGTEKPTSSTTDSKLNTGRRSTPQNNNNESCCSILEECHNLLLSLMQTVDGLLASCTINVWNTYGGLSRLCTSVEKILYHGLVTHEGMFDYWHFIQGLHQIKPDLAASTCLEKTSAGFILGSSEKRNKGKAWLKYCLENHVLSSCVEALTSCHHNLFSCYERTAFLSIDQYRNALLICLKAVEQNRPALLAELNPSLIFHQAKAELSSFQSRTAKHAFSKGAHYRGTKTAGIKNCSHCNLSQTSESLRCDNNKQASENKICICGPAPQQKLRRKHRSMRSDDGSKEETQRKQSTDTVRSSSSSNSSNVTSLSSNSGRLGSTTSYLSVESLGTYSNLSSSFSSSIASVITISPIEPSPKCDDMCSKPPCHRLAPLQRSKSDSVLLLHKVKKANGLLDPKNTVSDHGSDEVDAKSGYQSKSEETSHLSDTMLSESSSALGMHSALFPQVDEAEEAVNAQNSLASQSDVYGSCDTISRVSTSESAEASARYGHSSTETSTSGIGMIKQHVRSQSDVMCGSRSSFAGEDFAKDSLSGSLPTSKDCLKRRSLINGGSRVVASTECYFPKPEEGQSLTSFLSSKDFSDCAKLDRENAHFCISEALISAIEKIKCNQMLREAEDAEDESDEEIQKLKQRIRIRRRERQEEKSRMRGITLLSDGFTESTSTSQGASSPQSTAHSSSDQLSSTESDDIDELELSDTGESKLASLKQNGLSLSMASLYSDADIVRSTASTVTQTPTSDSVKNGSASDVNSGSVSAETVALCLLKKFTEKQLPKASDLMWLVSEQDAPQRLLPLPDSWPVSPDQVEEEYSVEKTRLRGSLDWAPPRAQVIFSIHPPPQRAVLVAKQNYRCAGCGMKVDRGYIKRFRYCEYLGKYFCHCCHSNSLAYIPARILHKWDFTKYYVSNFAKEVLDLLYPDPLFSITDINPALYKKVRLLSQTQGFRTQLYHLKEYIKTCRHSRRLKEELERLPNYWISDIHLYSITDLLQVRTGQLPECLHGLVMKAVHHVTNCPLCQAKGFICEFCRNENVIFPFQLKTVTRCNDCGSCSHKACFVPGKCPKCVRINTRRKIKEQKVDNLDS